MTRNSMSSEAWRSIASVLPQSTPTGSVAANARLRAAVAGALADDRVHLVYQPIVSSAPGFHPSFHEALVRLTDRNGTLILPDDVFPVIRGTELGKALDRSVLQKALAALASDPTLRLSVNLGPGGMEDADWLGILQRAHIADPFVTFRLIVEVSEHMFAERISDLRGFVNAVRSCGASLALDDFGAGATAFRHFRDVRFDMIKIDGQFIRGIHKDPDNQALVKALVSIAKHFEILCVAEFVENSAEADCLETLGVDCLQGYLFGEPTDTWKDGETLLSEILRSAG